MLSDIPPVCVKCFSDYPADYIIESFLSLFGVFLEFIGSLLSPFWVLCVRSTSRSSWIFSFAATLSESVANKTCKNFLKCAQNICQVNRYRFSNFSNDLCNLCGEIAALEIPIFQWTIRFLIRSNIVKRVMIVVAKSWQISNLIKRKLVLRNRKFEREFSKIDSKLDRLSFVL